MFEKVVGLFSAIAYALNVRCLNAARTKTNDKLKQNSSGQRSYSYEYVLTGAHVHISLHNDPSSATRRTGRLNRNCDRRTGVVGGKGCGHFSFAALEARTLFPLGCLR